jgi:hypothetical protein
MRKGAYQYIDVLLLIFLFQYGLVYSEICCTKFVRRICKAIFFVWSVLLSMTMLLLEWTVKLMHSSVHAVLCDRLCEVLMFYFIFHLSVSFML